MNSYLKITSRIITGETILSSQALFPPNTYYIPQTPIITLNPTDNACNATQITTNITNKILLVYTSDECSDHYKTYVAKQKGAIAVLIATSIDDTVNNIPGVPSIIQNATIPTRGISKARADWIKLQLSVPMTVYGEFGCSDQDIPVTICVFDQDGSRWWLDGNYVRQIDQDVNEHALWKKEGFYLLDHYIFLHTANQSNQWYWAITTDPTFERDQFIRARCNSSNATQPSQCKSWLIRGSNRAYPSIEYNMTVSADICQVEDSYICIKSTQSALAGLQGTYRLFNKNAAYWFREITECDSTPGVLVYTSSDKFQLYDSVDDWIVAMCQNTNMTVEDYKMNPQLCSPYETLVDNTLDATQLIIDDTLTIQTDKCEGMQKCFIRLNKPADSLCLQRSSILHMFLEGTYVQTGAVGPKYKSVEYVKDGDMYDMNGEKVTVYLLYWGEFDESKAWWILSSKNMSYYNNSLNENGYVWWRRWGYIHCELMNVVDCFAPWNFYVSITDSSHSDNSFQITEDVCPATTDRPSPEYNEEYEYICIDLHDRVKFETMTDLDPYSILGGYVMKRDDAGGLPYWVKPINDLIDEETFIYYDDFYGHWQISSQYRNDSYLLAICMSNAVYPEQCDAWYDTIDGSLLIMSFRVDSCTYDDLLRKSCSALHSWLQLSGAMEETVSSSHTLFAPYSYRVKQKEIVILDGRDNACEVNGIQYTDVEDKIVLISSKTSIFLSIKCSDHMQLYVMQENNASAVIIYGHDDTLSAIPDDDAFLYSGKVTYIPMRGIAYSKGDEIIRNTLKGGKIYGEFNCNDSYKYPLAICASNVGLDIYGNFEYQIKRRDKNGHPIWVRNSYSVYNKYGTVYLFLHHNNGSDYWQWAFTEDASMENDDKMIGKCNDEQNITNLIIEPTECQEWMVHNNSDTSKLWNISDLNAYGGICNVSDNYFCISSQNSSLAGLSGVYRLYYEDEPVWFREWDDCDTHPGIFTYHNGQFYLIDPMDNWIIATCYMGSMYNYNKEVYQSFAFRPDLCEDWWTVVDSSLDDSLSWDQTFQIQEQIDCSVECKEMDFYPMKLCLGKNSVMHSFLEGEYSQTDIVGEKFGTKEYKRNEQLYYGDIKMDVYIWYYGELTDKYPWWIISAHNMSVGDKQNYSLVFGYNACKVSNPANCMGNWNFYWAGMDGFGSWHNDIKFTLNVGNCPDDNQNDTAVVYFDEYEYICIDIDNDGYAYNTSRTNMLKGGYKMKRHSEIEEHLTGGTNYWEKPPNDYTKDKMYIYYDKFYGYWQIGKGLTIDAMLVCHNADIIYPDKCNEWYDLYSNSVDDIISFRVKDCSSKDMLSISDKKSIDAGIAAAIIIIIIILILSCIGGYCLWNKYKDKGYEPFDGDEHNAFNSNDANINSTEMTSGKGSTKKRKKGKKRRGHTSLPIGTDDDDDYEDGGLTSNTKKTTGYDMSPLERDKTTDGEDDTYNEHNLSDSNEDDDREHTDDQPDHGIDDAEDGILMTKY